MVPLGTQLNSRDTSSRVLPPPTAALFSRATSVSTTRYRAPPPRSNVPPLGTTLRPFRYFELSRRILLRYLWMGHPDPCRAHADQPLCTNVQNPGVLPGRLAGFGVLKPPWCDAHYKLYICVSMVQRKSEHGTYVIIGYLLLSVWQWLWPPQPHLS